MGKKRLKCFVSIINNLSCAVIFGVAVMSLVSPKFFVCCKDDLVEGESMAVPSETISKGEIVSALKFYTMPMEKRVVESELEKAVLDKVQRVDWVLVSVAQ